MVKYNIDHKKKYIELMKSEKHSIRSAAREIGVPKSVGERWWKTYQSLGMDPLIKETKNAIKNYSFEFKLYGIEYRQDNNLSFSQAAADLDITVSTLTKWEKIYLEEGEAGLRPKTKSLQPIAMKNKEAKLETSDIKLKEELIKENEKLKAEVAYLKKCIALTQEKKKLQTKKKQL